MLKRTLRAALMTPILLGNCVFAESAPPAAPTPTKTQSVLPLEDLRVFTKAYEHIRSAYIQEVDDKTLLEHAIRGMLNELDPHSSYLDASSFEELQEHTSGEFGGLGIEVGSEDGYVKVISPIDNTPAERAGIEAGDIIIKIDDESIQGLSLTESIEKMRGPKGSVVSLTIVREGAEKPFTVNITRDIIKVNSVRTELLQDFYGYVRIAQFQVSTGEEVRKAIETLMQENDELRGIVLDLRNNPGGVLQASVDVVDVFVDGGLAVYTEGRMENANVKFSVAAGDMTNGLPVVVLINGGSASASEIVAGALQDHNRAVLLGTRSFGKGSVQTVIPITDEKAIKLTTALYFTPDGRSIQAQGIVPDIIVERARVTALKGHMGISESELAGHLDNGRGEKAVNAKDREKEREQEIENLQQGDNQLYEAINLLKGLNIFQQGATAQTNDSQATQAESADRAPQ